MDIKDKEARIRLFLQLIDTFKADSWADNIYAIVEQYDMPAHLDREFVIDALVEHYVRKEEYEKCAHLFNIKKLLLTSVEVNLVLLLVLYTLYV